MTAQPLPAWKVIFDYLAGREQFEPGAARLAVAVRELQKEMELPPGIPAADDEEGLHGQMVWFPLDSVPEADRARASALIQRAFELLENGEAA